MASEAKIILSALDQTSAAFGSASRNLTALKASSDAVASGLRSLTGLLGAGALLAFGRNVISSAAALDDMAESTGASVEGLSRLQQVARVSGAEMQTVETLLLRVSKALAGADDESKGAAEAFKALGLSVAEMKKLAPEDQLQALAKALGQYADGANKTAIGQAILNKAWKDAAPLLKDLNEAGEVAANVTAEQAAEAERLEKSWNRLGGTAQDLGKSFVMTLMPAMKAMTVLAANVGYVFNQVGREIGGIAAQIVAFASLDFKGAGLIRKEMLADAEKARKDIDALSAGIMGEPGTAGAALPQAPAISIAGKTTAPKKSRAGRASSGLSDLEKFEQARAKEWLDEVVAGGEEAAREWLAKYESALSQETAKALARMEESAAARQMDQVLSEGEEAQREWVEQENKRRAEDSWRANQDAAKKSAEEWKRASDSIGESLTDALLRGFESGKDFAANLVDTVKNMFSTLVLKPLIQPIVQSSAGATLGLLGMGGAQASGGGFGGSDALGMLGNFGSALSGGTGMAYLGSMIGGEFGAGLAFGSTGVAGAAAGVGAMAGAGSATGTMGAALGTIGAAAPYIAAAVALYSVLAGQGGGPKQEIRGGAQLFDTPGRYGVDEGLQSLVDSFYQQYSASATGLGGTPRGDISAMLRLARDPAGDAGTQFLAGLAGGANYYFYSDSVGRDSAGEQAAITEHLTRMLVSSLKATDLDDAVDALFAGIDPASASIAQLNQVLASAAQSMETLAAETAAAAAAAEKAAAEQRKWGDVARDTARFRMSLIGGDLSPLDPWQKVRETGATFWMDVQKAKGGDMSAANDAQASASAYLSAAQGYYASSSAYTAYYSDTQRLLGEIQNTALRQADMTDLVDETRVAAAANEAGLNAMIAQLASIDRRLASIESTNALAAAA